MELSKDRQQAKAVPEIWLRSVGIVSSSLKEPSLVAGSGDLRWRVVVPARTSRDGISELVIDSDLDGILDGIEDFSHILVVFWAHRVPLRGRPLLKAHPMGRRDLPLVGIFATCSPARPNNICISVVRLLERKENILKVERLDAIDGSPIIDIKPYNPSYYAVGDARIAGWMEQLYREFAEGSPQGGGGKGDH